MINFRYHLVSLAAVFLALSIGIVLGAGPLKGTVDSGLTTTLTKEVSDLRADKAQLNSRLATQEAGRSADDALIAEMAPTVTRNALSGRSVSIIVLPSAGADLVAQSRTALVQAGAAVASVVEVDPSWVQAPSPDVAKQLDAIAATLGVAVTDDGTDTRAAALARALAPALAPSLTSAQRTAALEKLADLGLLSITSQQVLPANDVLLLAGPVSEGSDRAARVASATQWAAFVGGFSGITGGRVLAVSTPERVSTAEDEPGSVAAVLREQPTIAEGVSTVDNADSAAGTVSSVFALVRSIAGESGSYGLAQGADAPYAPLPTS